MATIYTAGHSNKPGEQFVALLQANDIDTLIDVRTKPYSRFNPQFNQKALDAAMTAGGIKYEWRGNNLGGLAGNVHFDESIAELVQRAEGGERLVVVCSEGDPAKCHRTSTLTPGFHNLGADVEHILWTGGRKTAEPAGDPKIAGAITPRVEQPPMFELEEPRRSLIPSLQAGYLLSH